MRPCNRPGHDQTRLGVASLREPEAIRQEAIAAHPGFAEWVTAHTAHG